MNGKRYHSVELPRIKRNSNSWEGKVIEYLLNHPSSKPATELSMEASTVIWLVEALECKVSDQELVYACRYAIERLEGKLATIKRIASACIDKASASWTTNLLVEPITVTHDDYNKNAGVETNSLMIGDSTYDPGLVQEIGSLAATSLNNQNNKGNLSKNDDEFNEGCENNFIDLASTDEMEIAAKLFGIES